MIPQAGTPKAARFPMEKMLPKVKAGMVEVLCEEVGNKKYTISNACPLYELSLS